jgi:hypothetical protein
MKSKTKITMAACLHALTFLTYPCQAETAVSVAALTLPAGSDGLLHWRSPKTDTSELQLSTRYFSDPVKLQGNVIQFFTEAVTANSPPPLPDPLLSMKIPTDVGLVYIVLWSAPDENGQPKWRGRRFLARDWSKSSLKVLNGCSENLGILAGKKKIPLPRGKSVDFDSGDWGKSFQVKIFRESVKKRPVFSSAWRVGKGRRELCFLFDRGRSVSIRSLIELSRPKPAPAP